MNVEEIDYTEKLEVLPAYLLIWKVGNEKKYIYGIKYFWLTILLVFSILKCMESNNIKVHFFILKNTWCMQ